MASFLASVVSWLTFSVCVGLLHVLSGSIACPCSDPDLCLPIEQTYDREVFVFSTHEEHLPAYDWSKITTVGVSYTPTPSSVCLAHSHGARVVKMVDFPVANLSDPATFRPWVQTQVQLMRDHWLDGLNFDFEDEIAENDTVHREGLTKLITMLRAEMKNRWPHSQLSVDWVWSPSCSIVDKRCYEHVALKEQVDYVFVMDYDMRNQAEGPCRAWANSPYNMTRYGMELYMKWKHVAADKLIMGLPWYGYLYPCKDLKNNVCIIGDVERRGLNCSEGAGREISYGDIVTTWLPRAVGPVLYDPVARAYYFNLKNSTTGGPMQMWFDNSSSLVDKVRLAGGLKLGGVGVWTVDSVDYSNSSQAVEQRREMWESLVK